MKFVDVDREEQSLAYLRLKWAVRFTGRVIVYRLTLMFLTLVSLIWAHLETPLPTYTVTVCIIGVFNIWLWGKNTCFDEYWALVKWDKLCSSYGLTKKEVSKCDTEFQTLTGCPLIDYVVIDNIISVSFNQVTDYGISDDHRAISRRVLVGSYLMVAFGSVAIIGASVLWSTVPHESSQLFAIEKLSYLLIILTCWYFFSYTSSPCRIIMQAYIDNKTQVYGEFRKRVVKKMLPSVPSLYTITPEKNSHEV